MRNDQLKVYGANNARHAITQHHDVYVVETPEEVDALAKRGVTSIAPLEEEDGWLEDLTTTLAGASSVALVARPTSGSQMRARHIAHSLYRRVEELRIVALPHARPNVESWLGDSNTRKLFAWMAKAAPLYSPYEEETSPKRVPIYQALEETEPIPDTLVRDLPEVFQRCLPIFDDERERDVYLFGSFVVLSGCLPNVWGRYRSDLLAPNLYGFIAAPAASGKGALKKARHLAEAVQKEFQKRYNEDVEAKKDRSNSGAEGTEFAATGDDEPVLRRHLISGNITASAFYRTIADNGGSAIMVESEADTLSQILEKEYGTFSDGLRAAFHHEAMAVMRVEYSREVKNPRLSVALSGTPDQLMRLMQDVENGLVSRFMFYVFVPDNPSLWRDVSPKPHLADPQQLLDDTAREVKLLFFTLEGRINEMAFEMSREQWELHNAVMAVVKERLERRFGYAGAGIGNRLGVQIFRLAMTFALWRAWEQGVDIASVESVKAEDIDYEAALGLGTYFVGHIEAVLRALPQNNAVQMPAQKARFLADLPPSFTTEVALELADSLMIPKRTAQRYLEQWVNQGLLVRVVKGKYRKA